MDTVLTGEHGKLKVGYQVVAKLNSWSIVRKHDTIGLPDITLTGIVTGVNGYWSRQRPMVVGVQMGAMWWVWRTLTEIEGIDDGIITAKLVGDPVAVREF